MRFLCTTLFQPSVDSTEAKSCFDNKSLYNETLHNKNWEENPVGNDWEGSYARGKFFRYTRTHKMRRERSTNEVDRKGKAKKSEVRKWI